MVDNLNGLKSYDQKNSKDCAFRNFQWVLDGKLARSSQPNYNGGDHIHTVSEQDVAFLRMSKIRCVISANEKDMHQTGRGLLVNAGIAFHRFQVPDFGPPSQDQFNQVANLVDQNPATLIYCGFGQGRTGTYVAGWAKLKHRPQINGLGNLDFLERNFGVETGEQAAAIASL